MHSCYTFTVPTMLSSWLQTGNTASNNTSPACPEQSAVFPPPRAPLDAVLPVLAYLPCLPLLPRLFSRKGLPKGYRMNQRVLILHIFLSFYESGRYHWASLRYNIPNSPLWAPADAPPLATGFGLGLAMLNTALALWIARTSRLGNAKVVRTNFQAWAIMRIVVTPLALVAARHGDRLLQLASFQDDSVPSDYAVRASDELAWAARLHGASSRILDIFAIQRLAIGAMLVSNWFPTETEKANWGNAMGAMIAAQACGLPGATFWMLGIMFALNAVEDWVGRAVKNR